ncbi:MAG TPA: L,D-transpeptidase, partial [Miltoncostaeaceae bacterium]|nr:L,D-transpeptidase [Miltoncostaeaceae bacterium]
GLVATLCAAGAAGLALSTGATAAPGEAARRASSVPAPPTPRVAWVGRLLLPAVARRAPRESARPRAALQPIAPLGNGPTVLMVTRSLAIRERRWVEVLLPIRPNGVRGWVPAGVLRLHPTPIRIVIDVSDRRLTVFRANRPVIRAPVAVGKPGTETPRSDHFAIAELIPTRTPGAFLGPIVMPITGYSERLNEFAGGNARVAIHGTSLPELIGTAASNGCIRMRNRDIVRVARIARPGTPVRIRS